MKVRFNLQNCDKNIRPVLMESWVYFPMAFFKSHEAQAMANHNQTLERLNQRGGLGPSEALDMILDRSLRRGAFNDLDDLKDLLKLFQAWLVES